MMVAECDWLHIWFKHWYMPTWCCLKLSSMPNQRLDWLMWHDVTLFLWNPGLSLCQHGFVQPMHLAGIYLNQNWIHYTETYRKALQNVQCQSMTYLLRYSQFCLNVVWPCHDSTWVVWLPSNKGGCSHWGVALCPITEEHKTMKGITTHWLIHHSQGVLHADGNELWRW